MEAAWFSETLNLAPRTETLCESQAAGTHDFYIFKNVFQKKKKKVSYATTVITQSV
jgi:hypothetical protein